LCYPKNQKQRALKATRIFSPKLIWEWVNLGSAGRDGKPGKLDSGLWTLVNVAHKVAKLNCAPAGRLLAKKTRKLIKN